jgi:hypothetical protein
VSLTEWPEPSRPPRGNGVNVHLKGDGGSVFVQDNYREVTAAWHNARRRQDLVKLSIQEGKRVAIPSEDIAWLEEL